jgi:lipopolysaccharide transport system permease protein
MQTVIEPAIEATQTHIGEPQVGPVGQERPWVSIRPSKGLASLDLKSLWEYRELLYFLVWRDVKVRYKQTVLGVLWVLLQPLVSMAIYTVLFGVLLKVPSDGAPYAVFAFAGLLPWQYFASALTRSSQGVVNSANLITKIYFPRLVIPLSGVLSSLVDLAVSFIVLIGLMIYYGLAPTPALLVLPALILLAMITALGFGLWLSALNVRYRDINYLLPFIVQVWMYVTPVVYGSNLLPERYRFLLALNPMTGVVEGFRWALLGRQLDYVQTQGPLFVVSVIISLVVLVTGAVFFRTTERSFADIV